MSGRRERVFTTLLLTVAMWAAVIAPASAYIDPGSTSLIFSVVVAFFAAAGMTLRMTWRRIVGFFKRDDGQPAAESADQPVGTADRS